MSKWNKTQGVVVPLESLIKERRKENCPAPRRSAGLVGRWGITSFTSIRSRSYVAEYNNVDLKDVSGLELGAGDPGPDSMVNLLGSNAAEPARPRKFFKSRHIVPPPPPIDPGAHFGPQHSPYGGGGNIYGGPAGTADGGWNRTNATTTTTPPQHFYQPLSGLAATPQFSPTGPQSANVGMLPTGAPDGMAYAVQLHQQPQQQPQHPSMLYAREPPAKEKKPGRRKKNATVDPGLCPASSKPAAKEKPKKEKKEKRPKKAKKEPPECAATGAAVHEQPKRNSSRIRNRVVNYNEDEDSNDYERSRVVARGTVQQPVPVFGTPEYGLAPPADPSFTGLLDEQQQLMQHHQHPDSQAGNHSVYRASSSPVDAECATGSAKPSTTTVTVVTPLPSPTISEHRPILLRISKGTSMLISTDSEEVSANSTPPTTALTNQQPSERERGQPNEDEDDFDGDRPPRALLADSEPSVGCLPDTVLDVPQPYRQYPEPNPPYQPHEPEPCVTTNAEASPAQTPPKAELKIKISLGGKPLISSTTTSTGSGVGSGALPTSTGSSTTAKGTSTKGTRFNFKKRAIERERARTHHQSSKRSKGDPSVDTNAVATPVPVSSTTVPGVRAATSNRPSFPLPGTDTYEVFRTLSSLSGGDDFDSQSSILGSASSDNTPKHTLAPGEDCQIIHSRGSSDCGSDLELSQNSSTAAAPPSDVYSESENTQDNNQQQHQPSANRSVATVTHASSTTATELPTTAVDTVPSATSSVDETEIQQPAPPPPPPPANERVEVLKLSLKNATGTRVTRNNRMKHTGTDEQPQQASTVTAATTSEAATKPLVLRVGRSARNRTTAANNNNNNDDVDDVLRTNSTGTTGEKRSRKQTESDTPTDAPKGPNDTTTVPTTTTEPAPKSAATRQYSRRKKNVIPPDYLGEGSTTSGSVSTTTISSSLMDSSVPSVQPATAVPPEGEKERTKGQDSSRQNGSDYGLPSGGPSSSEAGKNTPQMQPQPPAPPAPMRLVLQKKGTIFKSRPLVGSSDGATDAKKRHVYKHKWDSDNGVMAGAGTGAGSATGGVVGGGAGSGEPGEHHHGHHMGQLLPDGCDDGDDDDDEDEDVRRGGVGGPDGGPDGGGFGGGSGTGAGTAGGTGNDYDDDFDTDSPTPVLGIPPRSKRLKTVTASGGGCVGSSTGAGGNLAYGAGTSGSGVGTSSGSAFGASTFGFDECDGDLGDDQQQRDGENGDEYGSGKVRCERNRKPYYTIIRNVKNSHQMQEIGEFQEMDDDVDYILSALHPDNPISTRCLSALQLATKCLKPAFKMHVRAHGVVTRFFRALSDAHRDASLGLCTAAIMYVFSQGKLNMDLDRDSLELMLNLLDADHRPDDGAGVGQTPQGQLQRVRQRVKELCDEIRASGKANHFDLDRVTAGTLAMESLLSLTSQRAGEWFKDELRNLGGIEHLIRTVAECYGSVPERAADWDESAVAKLRKIERCLRVLNNVCLFNRANQRFLLEHRVGLLVQLLVRLYRQVDRDLMHYRTDDTSPKESVGVLLRELLQPILHMLITLTHAFDEEAHGAHLVGKQPDVLDITMHLLLRVSEYVPHRCVFDLHLLALTLLLHLARPSQYNRQQVLRYNDAETNRGGLKALVEYFEQQEEMASHAEAKTNAILETPARTVDAEDAETKLIQKAEHHMEHTYMGSHVCMLICQLVMDEPGCEAIARKHLKHNQFKRMVAALSRYYEFLNLTTNADAESTAHKRQTKEAIDYLGRLDGCETGTVTDASVSHCQ